MQGRCPLWAMLLKGSPERAIPLFRDLEIKALEVLAGRFTSGFYEPSKTIYEQGDAGDKFVLRGVVSISTLDAATGPSGWTEPGGRRDRAGQQGQRRLLRQACISRGHSRSPRRRKHCLPALRQLLRGVPG